MDEKLLRKYGLIVVEGTLVVLTCLGCKSPQVRDDTAAPEEPSALEEVAAEETYHELLTLIKQAKGVKTRQSPTFESYALPLVKSKRFYSTEKSYILKLVKSTYTNVSDVKSMGGDVLMLHLSHYSKGVSQRMSATFVFDKNARIKDVVILDGENKDVPLEGDFEEFDEEILLYFRNELQQVQPRPKPQDDRKFLKPRPREEYVFSDSRSSQVVDPRMQYRVQHRF